MRSLFRRHPWVLPAVFALVMGGVAWNSLRAAEHTLKDDIRSQVTSTLHAAAESVSIWREEAAATAKVAATDARVSELVEELLRVSRESGGAAAALMASPAQWTLRAELEPVVREHGFQGYAVQDEGGLVIAASDGVVPVGGRARADGSLLPRIFAGETVVTAPIAVDPDGSGKESQIRMVAAAPVVASGQRVLASLAFSLDPEKEFSRVLLVARPGLSGETYAFNAAGLLVSPSRFDAQLEELGLIEPGGQAFMTLQLRDPGGDLTKGFVPQLAIPARPFTEMAGSALSGLAGYSVDGYRDYRGVPVVGAWTWVPELDIGLATELDVAEAYGALTTVRNRFALLFGLVGIGAIALFGYSFFVARLSSGIEQAQQLGRYRIEKKIGRGGMGTVYLARHALLSRPTAIKVLNRETSGREGVERFEREVQITGSLRHPNTVQIYDYGRTSDGTFYYAMEYLSGVTVSECVKEDGAQPEARVHAILRQVSGSIAEAHAAGLIHRDLKPSNVMLCCQGVSGEFAKVLDFGLVRAQEQAKDMALTDVDSLTGTPLYLSPEMAKAPESVGPASDVYQIGLLGYFLLTGTNPFDADTAIDIVMKHVTEPPEPPSKRLGAAVSEDLENLLMDCLAKEAEDRPANAAALLERLSACSIGGHFGMAEARAWWTAWGERFPQPEEPAPGESSGSTPSGYTVDVAAHLRR
ncbi:MAG: serine/threonine-protein kinase [Myxococcota bacterium]|nr:serine/threonine-protein kinase [Myxococcota bacterium]